MFITPPTNILKYQAKEKEQDVNKKIRRTNWLIQGFLHLQIASYLLPQRVQCFCPYSSLVSLDIALAMPVRNCLDYEQNHCIGNLEYLLVE